MQQDNQQTQQQQTFDQILPSYSASVKVSDPESNSAKGFYTYLISGSDQLGEFDIRRRYNDFFYFREALLKRWPGVYIPPIPQKKIAGNKDLDSIEVRKRFFDCFMKRLAKIRHIFTSSITQEFIRNKNIEMEKFYSSMQAPKTHELINEYKSVYRYANLGPRNTHEIRVNIQSFGGFLKKAEKELEAMRYKVENIVDARQGFTQNLSNCTQNMLPDYEKNIYSEYLPEEEKNNPNLIFVHNMKVTANASLLKQASEVNSFSVCLDHLSYEILEVKAMEEALKIKQKYELELKQKQSELADKKSESSKLSSGKTTLKSFFSRGSKQNQAQRLQLQIPDIQKEISFLQSFNNITTIIFGEVEMPIFKRNKQIQYYRMMYEISQSEIKYMSAYGQYMKSILQGLSK